MTYEKTEKYFERLKKLQSKKDNRVFISVIKNVTETGVVTPTILIQVIVGDDILMLRYSEDLPSFHIVSPLFFDRIPNDIIRDNAKTSYEESMDSFDKKVDDEYNKMIGILTNMGFINIEKDVVVQI